MVGARFGCRPPRLQVLRAEIRTVGIVAAQTTLELAAASYHAVRSDDTAPAAAVHERLIDLARGG
ncbi:hypothetical protein [Kitasatospora sp. NPDC085879]|uniref:hypothetical protein n=1 Tax=Kitasatospora sp. NPDC085879 TaxID=3154769 RepID=UPI0034253905